MRVLQIANSDAVVVVYLEDKTMVDAGDVTVFTLTSNIAGATKFAPTHVHANGKTSYGGRHAWGAMKSIVQEPSAVAFRVSYDDFDEIADLAADGVRVNPDDFRP